jgi:hypothetical protein
MASNLPSYDKTQSRNVLFEYLVLSQSSCSTINFFKEVSMNISGKVGSEQIEVGGS